MNIVGNLLCDPNFEYKHIEEFDLNSMTEAWAMFALAEHVRGETETFSVRASGEVAHDIERDKLKKGDFIKITGSWRRPQYGKQFIEIESYKILKRSKRRDA